MTDEPLLSPKRILFGIRLWASLLVATPSVYVPLRRMVWFHRRPEAEWRYDERKKRHVTG